MPGLVLVEGVPGSGKSTLAEGIADRLRLDGLAATWWLEEDREHAFFDRGLLRSRHEAGFGDRCLDRWQEVVHACEDSWLVLEGSAFQSTVRFMYELRWPGAEIDAYWAACCTILGDARPTFVYLRPADARTFVESHTKRVRADVWDKISGHVASTPAGAALAAVGADVAVDFWVDYAELCDRLVAQWPHRLVELTPPADWDASIDRVLSAT